MASFKRSLVHPYLLMPAWARVVRAVRAWDEVAALEGAAARAWDEAVAGELAEEGSFNEDLRPHNGQFRPG